MASEQPFRAIPSSQRQRLPVESRVRGGNAGKAGWRAIGFDDRFVCTEPFRWYDGDGAPGE